ncbi:hypothetical protein DFH06DRAFT_375949 [Mycena polygramma]|nr:hypothetical protein DFH06DRAFT_375949 [Mycena polygramma]
MKDDDSKDIIVRHSFRCLTPVSLENAEGSFNRVEDAKPLTQHQSVLVLKHDDGRPVVGDSVEEKPKLNVKDELKTDFSESKEDDANLNPQCVLYGVSVGSYDDKWDDDKDDKWDGDDATMHLNTANSSSLMLDMQGGISAGLKPGSDATTDSNTANRFEVRDATKAECAPYSLDVPIPVSCSPLEIAVNALKDDPVDTAPGSIGPPNTQTVATGAPEDADPIKPDSDGTIVNPIQNLNMTTEQKVKEATKAEEAASSMGIPLPSQCFPGMAWKGDAIEIEFGSIVVMEFKSRVADELNIPETELEMRESLDAGLAMHNPESLVNNGPENIINSQALTPSPTSRRWLMDGLAVPTLQSLGIQRRRESEEAQVIIIPHAPRPARSRCLMDGLVVPTLQSVGIKRRRETNAPEDAIVPETPLSEAPRPAKRRCLMDGLVVPTLQSVGIRIHRELVPAGRRCLMDAVIVPTLRSLGVERLREIGEVNSIKRPQRSERLGAGILRARLISPGIRTEPYPIDLDARVRDVSVRRDFMGAHYGGNSYAVFPTIGEDKYTKTGHRYFMYPNLVQNPDAPAIPGSHGLFLAAIGRSAKESTVEWTSGTYKVLTRLGTHDNLYMGDYVIKPAESLTLAEWTAQPQAMRYRWCSKLAEKDWGRITRTRIALRRQLGRNPTLGEVDTAIGQDQEFKNITSNDISQAFDSGDERLAVWIMECVGYDEQFQRDLVRQITGWVPPPPRRSSRRRRATFTPKSTKTRTASAVEGKKRKPATSTRKGVPSKPKRLATVESEDESD